MHVPVIIGAVIEGPVVGAAVGLIFGLTSLFKAFTEPTITSFCFMNPIISVLPRVLIGIVAYYVYAGMHNSISPRFLYNNQHYSYLSHYSLFLSVYYGVANTF